MFVFPLTTNFVRRTFKLVSQGRVFPKGNRYCQDGDRIADFLLYGGQRPSDKEIFSGLSEWLFTSDRDDLDSWNLAVICLMGTELLINVSERPSWSPEIGNFAACYVESYQHLDKAESARLSENLLVVSEDHRIDDQAFVSGCILFACVIDALTGDKVHLLSNSLKVDRNQLFFKEHNNGSLNWSHVLERARSSNNPDFNRLFSDIVAD